MERNGGKWKGKAGKWKENARKWEGNGRKRNGNGREMEGNGREMEGKSREMKGNGREMGIPPFPSISLLYPPFPSISLHFPPFPLHFPPFPSHFLRDATVMREVQAFCAKFNEFCFSAKKGANSARADCGTAYELAGSGEPGNLLRANIVIIRRKGLGFHRAPCPQSRERS